MKNNGQIEHTGDAHWVMATATALGSIKRLAEKQEQIIHHTRESMLDAQTYLAKEILRTNDRTNLANPERVNAGDIERATRNMAEYQKDIERHETLRAAYRAAAAIIEAASGEYHYATREGYYGNQMAKFQTAEERDAFLEENPRWRQATDDDLEEIFWGQVIPTDGAPEA